jgi:hypothetical protein
MLPIDLCSLQQSNCCAIPDATISEDHISSAGLKCIQEGHEVAPLSLGWFFRASDAAHFEGSGLHFQINLCVNQGCIQRNMTQPAAYGVDIYAGAQQMCGSGVPEGVRANPLAYKRWHLL